MSPKAIARVERAFRWVAIASLIAGLVALVVAVGIEHAGWQLGFSSIAAGAVSIVCAGLHFIARIDTGAARQAQAPNH